MIVYNSPSHFSFLFQRSFRRLIFQDGDGGVRLESPVKSSTKVVALNRPPRTTQFLQLPYVRDIRPSVVLSYFISCSPVQLPAPHDLPGKDLAKYMEEILSTQHILGNPTAEADRRELYPYTIRLLYSRKERPSMSWKDCPNESKVWDSVQQSLEVYFQRISVADNESRQTMRQWYETMVELGSHYFSH